VEGDRQGIAGMACALASSVTNSATRSPITCARLSQGCSGAGGCVARARPVATGRPVRTQGAAGRARRLLRPGTQTAIGSGGSWFRAAQGRPARGRERDVDDVEPRENSARAAFAAAMARVNPPSKPGESP
jgi:hypothetical protein